MRRLLSPTFCGSRFFAALLGCWFLSGAAARAQAPCCAPSCAAACRPAPQPCVTYEQVEKTVMTPTTVMETRKIMVPEFRMETRQCTMMSCKCVPETKTIQETCTVLVPERRMRTECFPVCKPVTKQVTQTYTVNVPYQEQRQGTRRVCKPVTETQSAAAPQSPACSDCIAKAESCTVSKMVAVDEPYTYTVTLCRPETRTRTVNVTENVMEMQTREVPCVVCVPRQQSYERQVTVPRLVYEPHTQTMCVCVPHPVEKEIQVPVCKMVPTTVKVWVAKPVTPNCTAPTSCVTPTPACAAAEPIEPKTDLRPKTDTTLLATR